MHYYQHHIGDFIRDTAHLNDAQLATYLRMIWTYYDTEKPLIGEIEDIAFAMRSDEKTVQLLLKHYFKKTELGWSHSRCDREISVFHEKGEKARISANARWKNAPAMRPHSDRIATAQESDANQEPRTNNQEPPTKDNGGKPPKRTLDYSCWPEMPQQQTLDDWLAMRKRIKADVSQTVINQFGKELHQAYACGVSVDQCLATCVTSNWRGFKYSWLKNQEVSNAANQRQPQQTRGERNEQAFRDYIAGLDAQEDHSSVLAGLIGPATGN
jgi:uncharacterized protein YdaU (DUF1376 family)